MSKPHPSQLPWFVKIFMGLISLIPIVFWVFQASYFLGGFPEIVVFYLGLPALYFQGIKVASTLVWLYYAYVAISLDTIGVGSKILWIVRFVLMAPISMPIFWFYFIWRSEEYGEWEEGERPEEKLIDRIGSEDEEE